MEPKQPYRCPSCHSGKYTSLPFGNIIGVTGSASTYRCLKCNVFFSTRAPVQRGSSNRDLDAKALAEPVALGNLYGAGQETRYGLSRWPGR
jgi:hypothetical protein